MTPGCPLAQVDSRLLVALGRQSWGGMRGSDDDAPTPRGSSASIAERIARGIVPKWTNVSAANTMEYENALNAAVLEGHGSVVGLLHAMYTGDVDESQEGYLKYAQERYHEPVQPAQEKLSPSPFERCCGEVLPFAE